jgi:hypothetical protein
MTGLPYLIRIVVPDLGLRAPRVRVRGMDVAASVEAVGKDVEAGHARGKILITV